MASQSTFEIIMLGPRRSGKTVFLASMYHQLSIMSDDYGFKLKVKGSDVVDTRLKELRLQEYYANMATHTRQEQQIPSTQGRTEWVFDCYARPQNETQEYLACTFTYLDYDGGSWTNQDPEDASFFATKLQQQDNIILLGLLDGLEILYYMMSADDPMWNKKALDWQTKYLVPLINDMDNYQRPIHFVISKWDILASRYSLAEIKNKLMQIPKFKSLVKDKLRKNYEVRLIPVSSVGNNFAYPYLACSIETKEMEPVEMRIIPGKSPEPINVEIPLACAIRDIVKYRSQALIKTSEEFKKEIEDILPKPNLNLLDRLSQGGAWVTKALREIFINNPNAPNVDEAVEKITDAFLKTVKEKENEARIKAQKDKQAKENEKKLIDKELASLKYTLNKFKKLQEKLKKEYPESDLSNIK